jgi:hypothetical protein
MLAMSDDRPRAGCVTDASAARENSLGVSDKSVESKAEASEEQVALDTVAAVEDATRRPAAAFRSACRNASTTRAGKRRSGATFTRTAPLITALRTWRPNVAAATPIPPASHAAATLASYD